MFDYNNEKVANILLTGATGVLGGRILLELLQQTNACIYCLIRANSVEQATQRLTEILSVYDEQKTYQPYAWRIIPVIGDISKKNLGLSRQDYGELSTCIDRVIHCAANVSMLASYNKIAPVNVGGIQNIIEFCLSGNIPLLHTSSYCIVGDKVYQKGFTLQESTLDVGQGFKDMNYARTKFESEQCVHEAEKRGLRWVITRPGNIWGDSQSGCYPLSQTSVKGLYYEIIKTLVEMAITVCSEDNFDITPVDYVAKASVYAIMHIDQFHGRTLNLTNPNSITFAEIVGYLRDFGYRVTFMDADVFFKALLEKRIFINGKPYSSVFTDIMTYFYRNNKVNENIKFDTTLTQQWLIPGGITCPLPNQLLFNCYFRYLIEQQFVVSPQAQGAGAEMRDNISLHGSLKRILHALH